MKDTLNKVKNVIIGIVAYPYLYIKYQVLPNSDLWTWILNNTIYKRK